MAELYDTFFYLQVVRIPIVLLWIMQFALFFMISIILPVEIYGMDIITLNNDAEGILSKKAEKMPITKAGLAESKQIAEKLK